MRRFRSSLMVSLVTALILAPSLGHAGKIGGTLARYCMGGAGVGAVLGAITATVPYLNDKQPFDFAVGAGAGALTGVGVGLIFGIVDLATDQDESQPTALRQNLEGIYAFNSGSKTYLAWKKTF
jgi:hypothetical protein